MVLHTQRGTNACACSAPAGTAPHAAGRGLGGGWHGHTRAHGDVHARTQPLHSPHRTPAPARSAHSAHTYTNSISFPLHAHTPSAPAPAARAHSPGAKNLPRGAPCTQSWCPSHSLPVAAPSRVAPAAFGFPLGAPQVCASFVPRSPWHNQVPHACVNTETTVTGTRCQVGHGGAGEGSACTGSVCACTSVVLCWGGVYVCRGMCSRARCARCIDVHTRGVRAHTWAHTHTHTHRVCRFAHTCARHCH